MTSSPFSVSRSSTAGHAASPRPFSARPSQLMHGPVIAQLTEAGRHVVELADANRGTVIVGTHLAGSNVLLPGAIARLKVHHPLLTVVVREGTPEQLLTDLEAGRIDLIVGPAHLTYR